MAAVLLLLLSPAAGAKGVQHKSLLLDSVVVIEDLPFVSASVSVRNNNDFDFSNGKVVVSVPELGIRSASNVEVDKDSRASGAVLLEIPDSVEKGAYYFRVVVTNENLKRVRHRLVTIG